MKRLSTVTLSLLLGAATLFSCRKDPDPQPVDPTADMKKGVETLKAFFDAHRPAPERFSVDAATGGSVSLRSGTQITFPPGSFLLNGTPVSGPVNVVVRDVLTPANMILADKPSVTSEGEMLKCYGQIIVMADQGGQELQLPPAGAVQRGVNVIMPIGDPDKGNLPLWDGDTTITLTGQGYNHENAPVTITKQVTVRKGMEWTLMPGATASTTATANFFNLDSLGEWRNVDVLYNDPRPKTTVLGYFGTRFNPMTGANYLGQDPSMLFFKTRNTNTLVKLYNVILSPAAGKEGFLSYQNTMPVGQEGTFLAISAIGDKIYAEMRDVTIGAPAAGKSYFGVSFNPIAVSEAQLLTLINQMNSK